MVRMGSWYSSKALQSAARTLILFASSIGRKELSRDANRIDWKSSLLSDDPENFQVLDRGYSKDRQNVYYANWIVEDADPETFVVTGTATSHSHDKSHRYNMGRKEDMGRKDVEP